MIPVTKHPDIRLSPRASVFGKPTPWMPTPLQVSRVEPNTTVQAEPQRREIGTFLISQPISNGPTCLEIGSAQSIEIGWFEEQPSSSSSAQQPRRESTGPPLGVKQPSSGAEQSDDLAKRLAATLQPPLSILLNADGILEWPSPILPYQREGITALLTRREVLLADDMGLGKTIQAISALRILFFRSEIENALIVCPASLVFQWQREISKWSPELKVVCITGTAQDRGLLWRLPAHIKLISYDTLRGDVLELRDSPALRDAWSVVVLDEASRIKNAESGISIACKRLPRERRWALTGTPLENRVDDVISILEFLLNNPNVRTPGVSDPLLVREHLRRLQLRRKKEDVLADLPPKQVIEQTLELLPKQREAYDRAEQEGVFQLKAAGRAITVTHVLELISRLKQICNNDPVSGESTKLSNIEERLEILVEEGHRALVFSQFTDAHFGVQMIADRLDSFSPLIYTGTMSAGQKAASVDEFTVSPKHKALILSLRAGGVGLNLQAASYVFHLDRWWNPAIEEQAESRAHRMGQPFPVTVFRYICSGTIEEQIDAKLRAKRELFMEVVDDVSLDLGAALTEEELFDLFDIHTARAQAKSARPTSFADMSGPQFEDWLASKLRHIGFTVELTPLSRDGGVDLIASKFDELQIESKLLIQCKNHRDPIGVSVVRELRGVVPDRAAGTTPVVACPAGFTSDAIIFARSTGVLLWGESELSDIGGQ